MQSLIPFNLLLWGAIITDMHIFLYSQTSVYRIITKCKLLIVDYGNGNQLDVAQLAIVASP